MPEKLLTNPPILVAVCVVLGLVGWAIVMLIARFRG